MSHEFCPQCGTARLGAFRYCRACGLDFDATPVDAVVDPEPTRAELPPQNAGPRSSHRGRYLAIGAIGLVSVVGLSALAGPESTIPTTSASPPASTATVATPRVTTTPPTATIASVGPVGPTQKATVVRVTDGDTIRVEIDGQEFPVRYIGMDTPEPDDPDPTVKAFADQATAANAKLVEGQEVILERDVSDTDSFDRLLRDVWVDGPAGPIHVGLELVRQGFAQVSTYPPDVRYTGALLAAQVDARANGAGLWAAAPTAEPAPTRTVVLDDRMAFVGSDARTHFEGSIGDYTWAAVAIDGDRATVRWDVQADDADCQVAWRLEPQGAEVIKSTVRVDAGQREADNRRYDVDFEDAAFFVASSCPTWAMTMQTTAPPADGGDCDDSYPGVCIPPYPPDLDCGEIAERNFAVVGSDPHGFDREGDGIGCEA